MTSYPRIGLSACLFAKDPERPIFKGKALAYMEQSMGEWLTRHGALTYLIPPHLDTSNLDAYVRDIDGLVLQGGTDVAPHFYGEQPLRPEWAGDPVRDQFEIELTQACHAYGVPILGICRGLQILNVAFGGSLYQDISTQVEGSLVHRNWDIYDQNFHEIDLLPGTYLKRLYGDCLRGTVNSVHHQAIKQLADGFVAEATCVDDGIVEAIRHTSSPSYLAAVQWHPEFKDPSRRDLLSPSVLAEDFLAHVREYRAGKGRRRD